MQAQLLPAAQPTALSTKPHYAILDGLRGVAALTVVAFHLCEAHATSYLDQVINHGYLAVDFFFLLSGFVIGYAYDDRWGRLTLTDFFKARLVRLQPMVVMGMLVGALGFYFQASPLWPGIAQVPGWKVLLLLVIGSTLLPVPLALDIRGWQEMHPLNGPGWSLFYEYIANLLYALGARKLPNAALGVLVALAGAALVHLAVTSPAGDVVGGWAPDLTGLRFGLTRMLFPFFAGLLLSRTASLTRLPNAFLWCSLLLLAVLALPRVGGPSRLWLNGLYESFSIIAVFPLLVWLGAGGQLASAGATRLCKFFGDISYPLYITHYPLIYIYTAWVSRHKVPLAQGLPWMVFTFAAAVGLAYACLKFYDEPVRRWLRHKVLAA
ncbi:acyltransferase [Hymenobacter sp. BRD128]|uniref:acyltransferase family protein n=1 Tax=Hymenobacter sp. BRD128 TaxID=2675878 RepID=UPI001565D481|nr:acyltransferase [Hymenobacter sp. BRD128]QKG56825.1 acyltransferase [Hymenobacter sp. BRD128]